MLLALEISIESLKNISNGVYEKNKYKTNANFYQIILSWDMAWKTLIKLKLSLNLQKLLSKE